MTFVPMREQLRGLPLQKAELYGKPHVMCRYERDDAKSHVLDEGAFCIVCGKPATNVHHWPKLADGRSFDLKTIHGIFVLKPALFALCGSGTTGCHGDWHNGLLTARWAWDDDRYAEMWWDGTMLAHGMPPNSPGLFAYGRWVIGAPDPESPDGIAAEGRIEHRLENGNEDLRFRTRNGRGTGR